nr:alpha/beta hydrolase [Variibacter gotjawalensis]
MLATSVAHAQTFKPTQPEGYFFVGGKFETINNRVLMTGQMYVEYRAPKKIKHRYPVVMVHGTAQTGSNFTGTPDGRAGWAQHFVDQGFAVYIVDQVGRGRSGDNPDAYGAYTRFPATALEERFTGTENFKLWPQAKLHTQWPGGPGIRGNAAFDQFYASQVAYIASAGKTEEVMTPAMIALLQKVGPSILLTHSQASVFGFAMSDQKPDLVKAHIAVEPNGPPFFDVVFKGGDTWWETSGKERARAHGVTRLPLAFEPAVKAPEDLQVVQEDKARSDGHIRCWLQAEPVRKLPNIAKVPTVVVTGEASFRATYDDCTTAFLTQAGVKTDRIALGEISIRGNGHMMMLEKNNRDIAQAMIKWIRQRIR